jgi:hypothetical protein
MKVQYTTVLGFDVQTIRNIENTMNMYYYKGNQSTVDGSRHYSRNAECIKYTSDKGQYTTDVLNDQLTEKRRGSA